MAHLKYISAALGALVCGVALQVNAQTFTTPTGSMTGVSRLTRVPCSRPGPAR